MTGTLTVRLADPGVRVVDAPTGTWFLSGLNCDELEACVRRAESVETVKERVPSITEDAAIVHVAGDAGRRVHAFRSVTGGHRLYYHRTPDGEFVVSDHLRTALSTLPVDARTVSDAALADHFLFRGPVGADAIVDGVSGLGQGEWLRWDLSTDERQVALIDRLQDPGHTPPSAAPTAIESAYEDVLALDGVDDDVVNLYSGGVDSSLTQSLLDERSTMLNVGIDSPEYEFEMEYARDGTAYFDAPFEQVVLDETAILDHLEDAIMATGSPSCPFQTVLLNRAFAHDDDQQYLMAVGADSLFGNTGTKGARIADWLAPVVGSPLGDLAGAALPDPAGGYAAWLGTLDAQLSEHPASPDSYAQQYSTYTNPSLVATMFDEGLVADRCRAQFEYVRDRVPVEDSDDRFARQAAWRHHALVFGHRVGSRWRQMALAHGNTLVNPFETRSMTRCALEIPATRRFIQGPTAGRSLSTKYLLKRLLDRRVPDYPTDREKGAGVLPFERYFDTGGLASVFDQYPVPSFVPEHRRDEVLAESGRQAWNVVTYAVWRDLVQRNDRLDPVAGTDVYEWNAPLAASER